MYEYYDYVNKGVKDILKDKPQPIRPEKNAGGTIDHWEGIPVQVVEVKPNDVIIAQVSMHMDVSDCQQILQELQKTFPDNKVLIANKHVLEKLTIFRPEDTVADIMAQVDIDKELKKILRRDHYDFLY